MQFVEEVEVDIGDEDHLGVWGSLGASAIGGEGKIAGGEYARLGILNVHVVYFGQVACATEFVRLSLYFLSVGINMIKFVGPPV